MYIDLNRSGSKTLPHQISETSVSGSHQDCFSKVSGCPPLEV